MNTCPNLARWNNQQDALRYARIMRKDLRVPFVTVRHEDHYHVVTDAANVKGTPA